MYDTTFHGEYRRIAYAIVHCSPRHIAVDDRNVPFWVNSAGWPKTFHFVIDGKIFRVIAKMMAKMFVVAKMIAAANANSASGFRHKPSDSIIR